MYFTNSDNTSKNVLRNAYIVQTFVKDFLNCSFSNNVFSFCQLIESTSTMDGAIAAALLMFGDAGMPGLVSTHVYLLAL